MNHYPARVLNHELRLPSIIQTNYRTTHKLRQYPNVYERDNKYVHPRGTRSSSNSKKNVYDIYDGAYTLD